MEFFLEWMFICSVLLLGAASPGPDFVMVVRHALIYSRKTGFFIALGISFGIVIHVAYSIIGIAALIASSVLLFTIIKYLGAGFLIYMGIKALRSKGYQKGQIGDPDQDLKNMPVFEAIKIGFLTNVLNPKVMMFFFALFTQIIDPATTLNVQLLYGASAIIISLIWWSFVSFVLTSQYVRNIFLSFSLWVDRVCGGLMIAFGIKLAFSKV